MLIRFRSAAAALFACGVLAAACTDSDNATPQQQGVEGDGDGTGSGEPGEDDYSVTELVTSATDPDLINPWGIVGAEGVFWIADNGTGRISVYDGDGRPSEEYPTGEFCLGEGITGIAALESEDEGEDDEEEADGEFLIDTGVDCTELTPAELVVASEEGKLIAFNDDAPRSGVVVADQSAAGAVYLGVAKIDMDDGARVLAANFAGGTVDMFDDEWRLDATRPAAFNDPQMPAGWGPFNVTALEDRVYVSEAKVGEDGEEEKGPGLGAVAVFDANGNLLSRITSELFNAPWGVALKEEDGEEILMVGNFGDGRITEIVADTGEVEEQLTEDGQPISYEGLWGITMGSEAAGDEDALYFVAGPADETAGVYGRIDEAE